MQFVTIKAVFLCTGLALLLLPPAASQEQCTLPTEEDVKNVADDLFDRLTVEGTTLPSVQDIFEMQFTCLARVAKDMYAFATVIANFTTTTSGGNLTEQFQLRCDGGAWNASTSSFFKPRSIPFSNETQFQCYECEDLSSSPANYDPDSHCLFCAPECLSIGGGFCTGMTADDCCPFFNGDTGDCVDNCTTINSNFGYDENFTCVCQISCDPGFAVNTTDCSCELTDGCEAAGQPCQNGGTCISDLSVLGGPYYNCTCAIGYSGLNCTVTPAPTTTNQATSTTPTEDSRPPVWIIPVVVSLVVAVALIIVIVVVTVISCVYLCSRRGSAHINKSSVI